MVLFPSWPWQMEVVWCIPYLLLQHHGDTDTVSNTLHTYSRNGRGLHRKCLHAFHCIYLMPRWRQTNNSELHSSSDSLRCRSSLIVEKVQMLYEHRYWMSLDIVAGITRASSIIQIVWSWRTALPVIYMYMCCNAVTDPGVSNLNKSIFSCLSLTNICGFIYTQITKE